MVVVVGAEMLESSCRFGSMKSTYAVAEVVEVAEVE